MSFFISDQLDAGLKALKAKHGTPEAESIRRAVTAYLENQGVMARTPKGGKAPKKHQ